MKKLKLSLIALPFAALLFAGCDVPGAPKSEDEPSIENNLGNNGENGGGQNNNGGNNNGGGNHQETEIERVVRIVVEDICSANITYEMSSVARDKNKDTGVETESSTTTQLMMKDNGKVYSLSTTTFMGVNYTSEFYFETGEEKNYIYNKNKDGNWTKNEDLSGMSFDYRDTAVGFTEGLEAVKASYTIDAQGYYFAENVTYQVSPQSLVNQIGSIHYKDYTCTQESVTFSNEYIKIGITNNHLSYYEAKSHSVRMVEDAEAKTLTFMPNEYSTAVTRLHNIRDIGTTVVTLPIVE